MYIKSILSSGIDKKSIIIVSIIILSVALGLFIAKNQDREYILKEQFKNELESLLPIKFPDNTIVMGYHMQHGIDTLVILKIKITYQDLTQFIKDSPFQYDELTQEKPYSVASDLFMWDSKRPVKYKSCSKTLPNVEGISILISYDSQEYAVIYLMWFNT